MTGNAARRAGAGDGIGPATGPDPVTGTGAGTAGGPGIGAGTVGGTGIAGDTGPGTGAGTGGWAGGRGRALTAAGLGAACISASAVLVKLAGTGPATTAFYRCFLALPLLIALAAAERRRRGPRPPAGHLGAIAAGGFLAIDLVLWNHAIADVGAGIATVLGNLQVLFVAAAAWLVWRERPHRGFLLALPVVMAGVVLVSGLAGAGAGDSHPLAGIIFGIGTSVAYTAFLLIMRQTSAGIPHVAGPLAEATVGAALGSLLLGLVFGGLRFDVPWPSLRWLLLLSFTSQTVGWLLITASLPRLPAAVSSLLLLLQPVAALALAAAVLRERPGPAQLVGAVLVCGGVLAATRATGTARAAAPRRATARGRAAWSAGGRGVERVGERLRDLADLRFGDHERR
jgi:drug/metabolite transporter (DMT)-like permease